MVLLRVIRVESFETPEGELGRRIELVEERPTGASFTPAGPQSEEARLAFELAQSMFQAMQIHLPMFKVGKRIKMPKIILFLTEAECDQLGLDFKVNELYDVEMADGVIRFKKVEQ